MGADGMEAVLFDMDGTLVDSEKLWDISLEALYARLGGELTARTRAALVGSSAENTMRTVFSDVGLDPDPEEMAETSRWLHAYTGELFAEGLPWCPGARELLDALADEDVPLALVTNTERELTEQALRSIGSERFSVTVCGDEVAEGKPAPDPYLRAAQLLGLRPAACLAVEDSVTGTAAAESAGCPVLVVPNDIVVPSGPARWHADTLHGLGVDDLRSVHARVHARLAERSA